MSKNKRSKIKEKNKISSPHLELPYFFCLNKRYINDLQKEANVNIVISLVKYRKLFWEKFKQDLLDYLCLDEFLKDGFFCFDLDKLEEFAKSQGYNSKETSLENWFCKKYGKKTKDMIDDVILKSLEIAEKNYQELIHKKK